MRKKFLFVLTTLFLSGFSFADDKAVENTVNPQATARSGKGTIGLFCTTSAGVISFWFDGASSTSTAAFKDCLEGSEMDTPKNAEPFSLPKELGANKPPSGNGEITVPASSVTDEKELQKLLNEQLKAWLFSEALQKLDDYFWNLR